MHGRRPNPKHEKPRVRAARTRGGCAQILRSARRLRLADETGPQRATPAETSIALREHRRGFPIVRNRKLLDDPALRGALYDRIARMRRPKLQGMRDRMVALVRLDSDAAGIDDDLTAREASDARNMGMTAEDQRRRARLGALLDIGERRGNQFAVANILQIACHVTLRRCMTQKYFVSEPQARRQRVEPALL